MTVRIAAESPLQSNEQLYALDETRGTVELCDFTVVGVNRISVVGTGDSAEVLSELGSILAPCDVPVWWVVVWEHHEQGDFRVRSIHFQRKLEKEGYDVAVGPGLGVARISLADPSEVSSPPGVEWGRAASFLVAGEEITPDQLSRPPFRPTILMAARTHRLQPSEQFISEFSASARSLIYPVEDARDGIAWAIVTKLAVDEILRNKPLDTVYRNESAGEAWRM